MKVGVLLPGLHRIHRGAEVALESIADGLARLGHDVLVVGGGPSVPGRPYRYRRSAYIDRRHFERAPHIPPLRNEATYEELTFALGLLARRPYRDLDVTISCGYPFLNWLLTRSPPRGSRPPHVFVTENGDAPALLNRSEFKYFRCDGLVCTNPEFEERNRTRWTTALIPNGVDTDRFSPGPGRQRAPGLPPSAPIVLMVSALIESKHVAAGIRAVSVLDDAFLLLVGDGPLRMEIDKLANDLLPGRYRRITVPATEMPDLYRSADVLLHMSQTESFGNVYIEAMCSGLPVVAHNTRTTQWIFGEYPGLVDTAGRGRSRQRPTGRRRNRIDVHCPTRRASIDTILVDHGVRAVSGLPRERPRGQVNLGRYRADRPIGATDFGRPLFEMIVLFGRSGEFGVPQLRSTSSTSAENGEPSSGRHDDREEIRSATSSCRATCSSDARGCLQQAR